MKHSNSLFAISIQRCCCYMNMLNCYKTVKWILSALPFFLYIWTPSCLCAIQRFHRAACAGTVQIRKGLGFPNKHFAEQSSHLQAQRSNESPSGAFKRQNGLAQQDGGAFPRQVPPRCTECRQCKEKHGFPAGVQKVYRVPENGKSHEESYDSSLDFGVLEGTRIPGPLIKRAH